MGGWLPIIFSEIMHYADEYHIRSSDQRERLTIYVQDLDQTYLAHFAEQSKRENDIKTK